jgi:hypothetical protein
MKSSLLLLLLAIGLPTLCLSFTTQVLRNGAGHRSLGAACSPRSQTRLGLAMGTSGGRIALRMTDTSGLGNQELTKDDSEESATSTLTDDELEARIRALGLGDGQELTDKSTGACNVVLFVTKVCGYV